VTRGQLIYLFESADKERYNDQKFEAAIQGVDLESGESSGKKGSQVLTGDNAFVFKSQEEYAEMSEEERKAATDRMMSHWKNFNLASSPKGPQPFGKNI